MRPTHESASSNVFVKLCWSTVGVVLDTVTVMIIRRFSKTPSSWSLNRILVESLQGLAMRALRALGRCRAAGIRRDVPGPPNLDVRFTST